MIQDQKMPIPYALPLLCCIQDFIITDVFRATSTPASPSLENPSCSSSSRTLGLAMADHAQSDQHFMQTAIQLSERAGVVERTGRCFGAVVVKDGQIIGEGYNQVIGGNTAATQDGDDLYGWWHAYVLRLIHPASWYTLW